MVLCPKIAPSIIQWLMTINIELLSQLKYCSNHDGLNCTDTGISLILEKTRFKFDTLLYYCGSKVKVLVCLFVCMYVCMYACLYVVCFEGTFHYKYDKIVDTDITRASFTYVVISTKQYTVDGVIREIMFYSSIRVLRHRNLRSSFAS